MTRRIGELTAKAPALSGNGKVCENVFAGRPIIQTSLPPANRGNRKSAKPVKSINQGEHHVAQKFIESIRHGCRYHSLA